MQRINHSNKSPYFLIVEHILDNALNLCVKAFPHIPADELEPMLWLCARNEGLALFPIEEPQICFGYFHYWPPIVEAVESWDFPLLWSLDLRHGPIVHIAVLVTPPKNGYVLAREFINKLNPQAVSCQRYKNGQKTFHMKINPRFDRATNANLQ